MSSYGSAISAPLGHRRPLAGLALAAVAALVAAGCGGGSNDGSMAEDEVVARVEAACTKLSGYSVWLPEHLEKTRQSIDQGEAIVDRADDEFRSTLESLDPPADLQDPIDGLAAPEGSPQTQADLKANLKRIESLYEEVGAERCAEGVRASILTIGGASVEGAYHRVGLSLPPHPEGW